MGLVVTMMMYQVDLVVIGLMECVTKMGAIFRRSAWGRNRFMVLVPITQLIPPNQYVSQLNSSPMMVQTRAASMRYVGHFGRVTRLWRSHPLMLGVKHTI